MLLLGFFLSLISCSLFLADAGNRKLVETVPAAFSVFVLVLYGLAFFNHMWLADFFWSYRFRSRFGCGKTRNGMQSGGH